MFISLCFTVGVGGLGRGPTGNLCETAVCRVSSQRGSAAGPGRAGPSQDWLWFASGHFSAALIGLQSTFLLSWDKPRSCWLASSWCPGCSIHHPIQQHHTPVLADTVGAAPLSTFQEERNEFKRSQRICVYSSQAHQKWLRARLLAHSQGERQLHSKLPSLRPGRKVSVVLQR